VIFVNDSSEDSNPPHVELHVDSAREGEPNDGGIWTPWETDLANDEASIAEARRLGLFR